MSKNANQSIKEADVWNSIPRSIIRRSSTSKFERTVQSVIRQCKFEIVMVEDIGVEPMTLSLQS